MSERIPAEETFEPYLPPTDDRSPAAWTFHLGDGDGPACGASEERVVGPVQWATLRVPDQPCRECLQALDLVPADDEVTVVEDRGSTKFHLLRWCPVCYRDLRDHRCHRHLVGHDPADFGLTGTEETRTQHTVATDGGER